MKSAGLYECTGCGGLTLVPGDEPAHRVVAECPACDQPMELVGDVSQNLLEELRRRARIGAAAEASRGPVAKQVSSDTSPTCPYCVGGLCPEHQPVGPANLPGASFPLCGGCAGPGERHTPPGSEIASCYRCGASTRGRRHPSAGVLNAPAALCMAAAGMGLLALVELLSINDAAFRKCGCGNPIDHTGTSRLCRSCQQRKDRDESDHLVEQLEAESAERKRKCGGLFCPTDCLGCSQQIGGVHLGKGER